MARLVSTATSSVRDPLTLVDQMLKMQNPDPGSVIRDRTEQPYEDASYSRLQSAQVAGFMARHGFAVSMAGDESAPEDQNNAGARSENLDSPGTYVPVSEADIRLTSNAADKAVRKSDCAHGMTTKRINGSVLCHDCGKLFPDYASFQTERERRRKAADSDATDKSANSGQNLFKAAKDRDDNVLRDELAKMLYAAAQKETSRLRRNAIERLAQAIDAGSIPIPRNLAARTGAVRLSTGHRGGGGRHGWAERHGF